MHKSRPTGLTPSSVYSAPLVPAHFPPPSPQMPYDLETPNYTQFPKLDLLPQAFRNLLLCLKCPFLTTLFPGGSAISHLLFIHQLNPFSGWVLRSSFCSGETVAYKGTVHPPSLAQITCGLLTSAQLPFLPSFAPATPFTLNPLPSYPDPWSPDYPSKPRGNATSSLRFSQVSPQHFALLCKPLQAVTVS